MFLVDQSEMALSSHPIISVVSDLLHSHMVHITSNLRLKQQDDWLEVIASSWFDGVAPPLICDARKYFRILSTRCVFANMTADSQT